MSSLRDGLGGVVWWGCTRAYISGLGLGVSVSHIVELGGDAGWGAGVLDCSFGDGALRLWVWMGVRLHEIVCTEHPWAGGGFRRDTIFYFVAQWYLE